LKLPRLWYPESQKKGVVSYISLKKSTTELEQYGAGFSFEYQLL
jgi:hypothetical protein